jgi:hypothetical protein
MEDEKPLGLKILVKILDTIAYLFFASISCLPLPPHVNTMKGEVLVSPCPLGGAR